MSNDSKNHAYAPLSQPDLHALLDVADTCVSCESEETLHSTMLRLARFIGFEFVLYAYVRASYDREQQVHLVNLSNPATWMAEYDARGYLQADPVRLEFEHRLRGEVLCDSFTWDTYERPLSSTEIAIIERRRHYGLLHGCSGYCHSENHESAFLISFASAATLVDARVLAMVQRIVPHLNRGRKRLDLFSGLAKLTGKERVVAAWLARGKTNGEIAQHSGLSERAVKFHVANILEKLGVTNRKAALSLLLAARLLA